MTSANAIARPSGRAVDELRPFSLERGFTRYAEGSVLVKACLLYTSRCV